MATNRNRFAAASACAAAFSMAAMPASAAQMPRGAPAIPAAIHDAPVHDADADNAARHRWYRYGGHRGPRTGDVIAGVLVLGTIAAIVGSASKNREQTERYPTRQPYPEDRNYREPRGGAYQGGGIGRAVDMCIDEVERMRGQVDRVDNASRRGDGWHVGGELRGGDPFSCQIDNDGRISDVQLGEYSASADDLAPTGQSRADGAVDRQGEQWDDDSYARARQADRTASERQPAYPGGPIEGEAVNEDDGRYSMADAPDCDES